MGDKLERIQQQREEKKRQEKMMEAQMTKVKNYIF